VHAQYNEHSLNLQHDEHELEEKSGLRLVRAQRPDVSSDGGFVNQLTAERGHLCLARIVRATAGRP
jgi:hypothetical protein